MAGRSASSQLGSWLLIGGVVVVAVGAFAYTAGWLTPERLTPTKLVDTLAPPTGAVPGFRRNHAKGICFTGTFESNGAAAGLSRAQLFAKGAYPVVGRFNLATPNPVAADPSARVRGLSLMVTTPDGREWRSAMIDAPFFPVATPEAFYALLQAGANKSDPDAMKNFIAAHPEFKNFLGWATTAPWTSSYVQERYNSLNSFILENGKGDRQAVRWSFLPAAPVQALSADELKAKGADFLASDLTQRVGAAPQRWTLQLTLANAGDPTADPSKAWPDDRPKVAAGTLVVQAIQAEPDGPCRDLNFDPTVLPPGMQVSDDPFPAARSAAYSVSFNRRTAEADAYPRTAAQEAKR